MESIDTATLRAEWRERLVRVNTELSALLVLNHGRPEAVLLSEATWLRGCLTVPVADADRHWRAASDVRSGLSAVRTAAYLAGQHTLIRKLYGTLYKDDSAARSQGVIAPCDWVRRALPELAWKDSGAAGDRPPVRDSGLRWVDGGRAAGDPARRSTVHRR